VSKTIVISSDARKMGKTLLGEALTARLSGSGLSVGCMKLSRNGHGPDSPTSFPGPPGSDTNRYRSAGAEETVFFKFSSTDELRAFMESSPSDADVRIIESNSVLEVIEPDLHIHICSRREVKRSATGLEENANLVAEGPLDTDTACRLAGLVPALMGMGAVSSITVGGKHWLNIQGDPLFGEGRMDLLKAVRETGSILQAAKSTGIQYKRAWIMLHDAERRIGARLVSSGRGGEGGGGSSISPLAERLLEIWERSESDFEDMLKRLEIR
jgi:molybdate transport system regulatory protein